MCLPLQRIYTPRIVFVVVSSPEPSNPTKNGTIHCKKIRHRKKSKPHPRKPNTDNITSIPTPTPLPNNPSQGSSSLQLTSKATKPTVQPTPPIYRPLPHTTRLPHQHDSQDMAPNIHRHASQLPPPHRPPQNPPINRHKHSISRATIEGIPSQSPFAFSIGHHRGLASTRLHETIDTGPRRKVTFTTPIRVCGLVVITAT